MKRTQILIALFSATLGVASLSASAQTASAIGRTIEASASVKPAAPSTGENVLEVTFMEAAKPVVGLKLTASVGMTNMDMGTSHPEVKEPTAGHYVLKPMFLMDGPWRVTLASKDPKFTVSFDMTSGAKTPWPGVKRTIKLAGMDVVPGLPVKAEAPKPEPPMQETTKPSPILPGMATPGPSMASMISVATSMPVLKENGTYAWTGDEEWDTHTGFGKLQPMVRMMTLMMVTGSGMEGMKMAPMDMKFNQANFTDGGEDPMASNLISVKLKVEAKLGNPAVGNNNVTITIATVKGKMVEKAKVTAAVAMTSMDMGTTHPVVKDLGKGKYALSANFSMAGPWRLTLTVSSPGVKKANYTFDFEAK